MKWKVLLLVFCVLMLIVFGIAASYFEAQIFTHNSRRQRAAITQTPAQYGLSYESITLTSQDGKRLAGWYIPSRNRAAVIVLHDYKSNRSSMLPIAAILAQHGYGVIAIDLRAHGESDGDQITFGLYEVQDADAAFQYLRTRPDVDPDRIGALGVSTGAAIVLLQAAQNPGIKAVVAEGAYTCVKDVVPTLLQDASELPSFLLTPAIQWFIERGSRLDLSSSQLMPIKQIGSISPRAVFLLQGGMDEITPLDSGQRLYNAAGEPRELWFDPQVPHNMFSSQLADEYKARVPAFLDRYLLQ